MNPGRDLTAQRRMPPGRFATAGAGLWLLILLDLGVTIATAQTYTLLHCFGTNAGAMYPAANLVRGEDGILYGTTRAGGSFNQGTVFKLTGTNLTVLKEFSGSDGAAPQAALFLSGSTLYGTTFGGGIYDRGTIFKLNTDGSGFSVLKRLDDVSYEGQRPKGGVVLSGSTLYGTTQYGGTNGHGAVFRINIDGSGYALLHCFDGVDGDGPQADLLVSGATLYGTTFGGGTNGAGTVFKLGVDGNGFSVLMQFPGGTDAGSPQAGLVLSGDTLYGTAFNVFRISTNGTGFDLLTRYDWSWGEAGYLSGGVVLTAATIYGSAGNLFRMSLDGSHYTVLAQMERTEGTFGLVLGGSTFYGTTSGGGSAGFGKVFSITMDGSGYEVLQQFTGGDGYQARAGLTFSGTTLYGATERGGSLGSGTLFAMNLDGGGYSVLKNFSSGDGRWPDGGMALSGTTLYGTLTRWDSGNGSFGTFFKINTDGGGYAALTNIYDGGSCGGPVISGATVYGAMAWGGTADRGMVFKVNTDGSGYAVLKRFTGADGANPAGALILSNTTLYGVTHSGGSDNHGTVFKVNTDGSGYVALKHFTDSDAGAPSGGLAMSGKTLFGVTHNYGYGALFKVNTDGGDFAVLKQFNDYYGEGAYPEGGLVLAGVSLYGATREGGTFGHGVVFRVNLDGGGYLVLKHFAGSDGVGANSGLLLSGMTLYGTAYHGGGADGGVVFGLSLPPVAPLFEMSPRSLSAESGAGVDLKVGVTGFPSPDLQWFFNGDAIGGATNAWLALDDLQFGQSGAYTVVITNAGGSLTSSPAMLGVIAPVERRPVPAISLTGDAGSSLVVNCVNSQTPPCNWWTLGTVRMNSTSQYYFDVSAPLPALRFYRARQVGAPGVVPALGLRMVPALTLTGSIGCSVRVDCINAIGPTDAWVTLDTVPLTNTSQLYFDVSAPAQPQRLYRLLQVP